mgnify:CR=1 FL=1
MDDFATGYLAGQDGGNNNGGFFGNEGLWAVIILAIIFGWGTNGYGRNGGDNGMNAYIPYLVGTGATGQGGADTRAALSEASTSRIPLALWRASRAVSALWAMTSWRRSTASTPTSRTALQA